MNDDATASAITFGTDGWRATLDEFTTERVRMVGQAVATFLDDEDVPGAVAIGYDARETSPEFADALAAAITANGRDIVLAKRDCPTPALAWTVANRAFPGVGGGEFAGGLVVTASHNPPDYNGVKFIPASGAPALPEVTDALEDRLAPPTEPGGATGTIREVDLVEPFVEHACSFVAEHLGDSLDLDGLAVAYDAMHGSGRGVTDVVLDRAGASVSRLRCERDPEFGGTNPEPAPENAERLVDRVEEGDAELGLINDGDADRVGIVTPARGFLDPNVVLAVVYEFLLERDAGDAIRTVSTSSLVDRVAHAHGQSVHETPVGFKWVAEAMGKHDALAGGEESGGYGVTAHLRNKDGVVLALLAAVAHQQQPLDDRIDDLFETYGGIYQDRISLDCPDANKEAVLDALEADLPETFAGQEVDDVTTVDGFKLTLADGTWLLVRPSGTEPKLRVYAEATSEQRVSELLDAGSDFVGPVVERV
jgi:phosphomannomutase